MYSMQEELCCPVSVNPALYQAWLLMLLMVAGTSALCQA